MQNKIFKFIILIVISFGLNSCTSYKIVSQQDKTVDFNKFKTYSFYGWKGDTDNLTQKQISIIEDSFGKELQNRGLTHKENGGDLVLSFFIVVDKASTTNRYNGYYGFGSYTFEQPEWGWGSNVYISVGGLALPPENGVPYKENAYYKGTIVCDAFDNSTKKLAWQSVFTKALNPKKQKGEPEVTIPKIVTRIMKRFPIQAK